MCVGGGCLYTMKLHGGCLRMLQMYPGGYHQIHNESGGQGEEAVSDLIKWITDSLTPKKQGEHPPDKV